MDISAFLSADKSMVIAPAGYARRMLSLIVFLIIQGIKKFWF